MLMKYTTILNSKPLCFIDKILNIFNYYIVLQGVDTETKEFDGFKIQHASKIQWK